MIVKVKEGGTERGEGSKGVREGVSKGGREGEGGRERGEGSKGGSERGREREERRKGGRGGEVKTNSLAHTR